jgi:hypothetical protein
MITLKVLEYDDKIRPDDLVRKVYPASYYCAYSDDNGESTLRWHYAKFHMPGWIGKTLKQYRDFDKKDRHYAPQELMIVRVPPKVTLDELNKIGMPVTIPSACLRRMEFENLGKSKFGNMKHYPKKVKLTFGKYKGKTVEEVYDYDQHYLIWLNDNVKLKDEIKESVEDWLADSDPIC